MEKNAHTRGGRWTADKVDSERVQKVFEGGSGANSVSNTRKTTSCALRSFAVADGLTLASHWMRRMRCKAGRRCASDSDEQ